MYVKERSLTIKKDARTEPDIITVGFYPHSYASVNLQVQRVRAMRAHLS